MNNDVIYEKELALAKRDFIAQGNPKSKWDENMMLSLLTVRSCGFYDGYAVRRLANKWRVMK